jgi:hypothetical protein
MRGAVSLLVAGVLAGCTSSQVASIPPAASPNVAQSSTLQFAVGTATIGLAGGTSSLGLNVVATFRQPNGNNATNVNTPTLTAPAGVNFGPLLGNSNVVSGVTPAELATLAGQANATPVTRQLPVPASFGRGFGPFVGVFGYGLAGDNLISNSDISAIAFAASNVPHTTNSFLTSLCTGVAGGYLQSEAGVSSQSLGSLGAYYGLPAVVAYQSATTSDLVRSAELALPIPSGHNTSIGGGPLGICICPSVCGTTLTDPAFPVQYFGGPPAWPSPQGYGNYSYFVGYPLGFTTFVATPVAGNYSLSVAYPTSANYSTFGTFSKTARLASVAPLPVFAQPALTINPDGSGAVTVNVPAGVREAVVTIASSDCDYTGRELTGSYYNHFALETQHAGVQTLFLSANLGPPGANSGLPTHTFCTTSDLQALNAATPGGFSSISVFTSVAAVGFDYPAAEASYPFNLSEAPAITNGDGHTGQADVTTSYPLYVQTSLTLPTSGG